ncbi:MAG: sigma-70 family RNA polymerase sigma factor [Deltaproteobacteria bacterium]|nr:sigma-70 family RNA polymerase sigma factor [Deltaproteobacteria bacterium]
MKVIPGGRPDSREALRDLYQRYGPAVRSRCRYVLKNPSEAEDAMHEVFAKALQHLDRYRREASPLTWLMQIATHHCLNMLRAHRAAWKDEVQQMAKLSPVSAGEPVEGRDLVRAILVEFDPETQAAAIHYYVDEMTLEEVAAAIGRSVPTVRTGLAQFADTARTLAERLGLSPAMTAEGSHG